MPFALSKDVKQAVQSLFLQGFTAPVIALKTGVKVNTVHKWKAKFGWTGPVDDTKPKHVKVIKQSLASASEAVRNGIAARLVAATEQLPKSPLSLKGELKLQSELEPLVRNAKTIFAWAEGQEQGPVNVSFVSQYAEVNVVAAPATPPALSGSNPASAIIDVTPVTLTEPGQSGPVETPDP